jgi:hypothetical protein
LTYMKIVRNFWVLVIIVIMLSSMFISAVPVTAADYDFSVDFSVPTSFNGLLAPKPGFGVNDITQSGSTIYAACSGFVMNWLYTSPDGGGIWYPVVGAGLPVVAPTVMFGLVAVAPDNPNIVAVVDTAAVPNDVYISNNGGNTFKMLPVLSADAVINAIDISSLAGSRYLAIGGHYGPLAEGSAAPLLLSWEIDIATAWVIPDSEPLGSFASITPVPDDIKTVKFSPGFPADMVLLAVFETRSTTGLVPGDVSAHIYSYMFEDWDTNFSVTFPRMIETSSPPQNLSCARACITLDPDFILGDDEIGFIGAEITIDSVEAGGVYRLNTDTPVITQIYVPNTFGLGINSVAWDGANLMAAEYDTVADAPLIIFRCANALASSGWTFLPSASLKTPGTGTLPLVIFNGGAGYCFSRGQNSAVARTTDFGKTFDGVALVNSHMNNIIDFCVSHDGARMYLLADDGTDIDVWSKADGAWKRCAILCGYSGSPWMVRAAQSGPNAVYLGEKFTKNILKSTDGGAHWTKCACTQNIQDFAVQDADTVYVAVSGATTVVKTNTGASDWLTPVNSNIGIFGDHCYSLNLVADDQLVVGGTTGGVSYSNDGGTSWNWIPSKISAGGITLVTATTTGGVISTGDTIFAASSSYFGGSDICKWKIGTNTPVTGWDYDYVDKFYLGARLNTAEITGLVYANGVLYAWDNADATIGPPVDTHHKLYRFIYPTIYVAAANDILYLAGATSSSFSQANMINALQYSMGSTSLWVCDSASVPDTIMSYTENLIGGSMTPTPSYPINGDIIGVDSIFGGVNAFNFMWTAPAAESPGGYRFDLQVFMDELGTVPASGLATAVAPVFFDGGTASYLSYTPTFAFAPVAGETYYWKVRVSSCFPVQSYWSAMQTFSTENFQGYSRAWYLNNDLIMYRGDIFKPESSLPILDGEDDLWLSDEAADGNVVFPSDTWTSIIRINETLALGEQIGVTIGTWNGSVFTPVPNGSETITGDGFSTIFVLNISANSFAVMSGEYLALEITNPSGGTTGDINILTGGINSFIISPDSDPGYPVPEFSAGILLGLGLTGLTAFFIIKKRKTILTNPVQ